MKVKEIRDLNEQEIKAKLAEKKKELNELNLKLAMKTLEKPALIPALKKDIARMLTVLKEKGAK
ncbi:MAG: 50S ribosomal protein L29 [Candidatus Firestonebacteria bacterium]